MANGNPAVRRDELEMLIRARYPVINVVSYEEQRVLAHVQRIAERREKKVYTWSFNTGVIPAGLTEQSARRTDPQTRDPLAALDRVIGNIEPAIFVFFDFHPYMGNRNFAVIRRLREVAAALKNSYKTLIIITPAMCMTEDLEKDVTVIDYPLPDLTVMEDLLDQVLAEVRDNPQLVIDLPPESREALLQAALELIRKSGILEYYEAAEGFENIGGLDLLKEWLWKRSFAFTENARAFGLPAPKGALFLGVQGCGKSLCAKAVSAAWKMPLLRFDAGRLFSSALGSTESNMRRSLAVAESISPCILWIDEIEKAFGGVGGSGGDTDGGTSARIFGALLT